jgi:hypothetical protein
MALWRIHEDKPRELQRAKLNLEARLEDWIAEDYRILGLDVLLIGRQIPTAFGGRIDLLAIDSDGNLTIVELKRDKTPREIVAQTLDYASWVQDLTPKQIHEIAAQFLTKSLDVAFSERFGLALPDVLNASHRLVVVASELDESSERIIQYLVNQYGVDINAIFFNFFTDGGAELLGRSWLVDPKTVSETSEERKQPPWSGFWYVNVGEGPHRNWDDCRRYGFLSAGQGRPYSDAMKRLSAGDRVFAYQIGRGYVGYGEVRHPAVMARDFTVPSGERLLSLDLVQPGLNNNSDDSELSEWVVDIDWKQTVSRDDAKKFTGIFANQNIVCKLRDTKTLEFLKREFSVEEEAQAASPSLAV